MVRDARLALERAFGDSNHLGASHVRLRRGMFAVTERPQCDVLGCIRSAQYRLAMGHSETVVVKQTFICQWHLDTVLPHIKQAATHTQGA